MLMARSNFPPGLVGVISREEGRYSRFAKCVSRLIAPEYSADAWVEGGGFAENRNAIVSQFYQFNEERKQLNVPQLEWLCFLDDDNTFEPDILMKLLARRVDMVQPMIITKKAPFKPYIYRFSEDGKYITPPWNEIPKSGIHEWGACATGGLLIQKRVLDAVKAPWFEEGKTDPAVPGEDLWFAQKAVLAGFRCHVDIDNKMGHTAPVDYWPSVNPSTGEWEILMDIGRDQKITFPTHVGSGIKLQSL